MVKPIKYPGGRQIRQLAFHWDMDTDDSITVSHSLDIDKIRLVGDRPIEITIESDSGDITGLGLGGGAFTMRKKEFELWRPIGGYFDGPKYRNLENVRGYITILYKAI